MIIPKNNAFWDYNLNFHRMIDVHSKQDKMYKSVIFYALIFINNHIITCIDCKLSVPSYTIYFTRYLLYKKYCMEPYCH